MKGLSPSRLDRGVTLYWVDDLPVIETPRLLLSIALTDQVEQIVRYLVRNREHLKPWEPKRNEAYFSYEAWIGAPKRDQEEARVGSAYRFRLMDRDNNIPVCQSLKSEFLGTVSIRNILGWPMRNATLGYSLDCECQHRGLMTEAVSASIQFAFRQLRLVRLEACYMPSNSASEKLLAKLGFQHEGLLRKSLEVNGNWEDHNICSLINPEWRSQ